MTKNGELSEAQRLLLQKFPHLPEDDPLVELTAWNAALEAKVDQFGESLNIWTQAILKQTDLASQQNQLIVSQNIQLRETATSNVALGQTLTQLRQDWVQLQREFSELREIIVAHGSTLSSLSAQSDRVSRKLDELSLKLNSLSAIGPLNDKVEHLTKKHKTLTSDVREGLNANRLMGILIAVVIVGIQIMQLFMYKGYSDTTQMAIQGVRERTEWALTKLERLENR